MVCWRKKVPVPEEVRAKYQRNIEAILDTLEEKRQVFVDAYVFRCFFIVLWCCVPACFYVSWREAIMPRG